MGSNKNLDLSEDFRDLGPRLKFKKNMLIKKYKEEFRLWYYTGVIDYLIHKVDKVDYDIFIFFSNRLDLVNKLYEFNSLFITLDELSYKINTETYYSVVYLLKKFVEDNELKDFIEEKYIDIFNGFEEIMQDYIKSNDDINNTTGRKVLGAIGSSEWRWTSKEG